MSDFERSLHQYAEELATIRHLLNDLRNDLRTAEADLAFRTAELSSNTTGKNAEERKANLAMALANDDRAIRCRDRIDDLTYSIGKNEVEEQRVADLRRATEWSIRLLQAQVLKTTEGDVNDGFVDRSVEDRHADRQVRQQPMTAKTTVVPSGRTPADDFFDDVPF
jgi:hypothetical protein